MTRSNLIVIFPGLAPLHSPARPREELRLKRYQINYPAAETAGYVGINYQELLPAVDYKG